MLQPSLYPTDKPRLLPRLGALLGLALLVVLTFWLVLFRRLFKGRRHPLWDFRKELVAEIARTTTTRLLHLPPSVMRNWLMPAPIQPHVRLAVRHECATFAGLYAEFFTPRTWSPDQPTLLYYHGGGYLIGSPGTHRDLVSRIARASGARCICVAYRKAPEYPFPAGIDDAEAAYRALLASGVKPERIFLGGDSAGGGMTLAVVQRAKRHGLPMPRGAVLLSPWVDLTLQGESITRNAPYDYLTPDSLKYGVQYYLQGQDPAHPEASAIFADLRGLPPLLLQTGDAELFYSENVLFAELARAQGVQLEHQIAPGMVHVSPLFASVVPSCAPAIERIGAHIRALHAAPLEAAAAEASLLQAG